jgi:hypothetical protein
MTIEEIFTENLTNMKLSKRVFRNVEIDTDNISSVKKMVSLYYMMQDNRIRVSNQKYALEQENADDRFMNFFKNQMVVTEGNIATFLDVWTDRHPVGKWLKSNTGIGPVIAAGLVSRFDIKKTRTAGGFWKYAGIAEGMENRAVHKKGEISNYCDAAKVLAWKASSSFKMQCTRKNCYYGKLYIEKKAEYVKRNEEGKNKRNAEYELSIKKFDPNSETYNTYKSGKLPAGHIDAMALRYTAKIFISNMFDVMWMYEYGEMPPYPFATTYINGHTHIIYPQNLDVIYPYLQEKFPNNDWKTMINTHYKYEIIR